ncbi:hypothetical protein KHS38_09635 [Mucilaginibacter sp. Bleaf8]|uniref:hypothetical protein n=1 Tax=Mucilaginibacter sp. Bleaf8 TaxID=2834430 RepID=UPI001BCB0A22|nr:hypothetical protein [Mucilaginibacter sp. Bleaf8]MBS7564664.1 hypothetical protein [Mucilaginibacter sp. Bleaf8]
MTTYNLKDGITWNTELLLYEQVGETRKLTYTAILQAPIKETTEPTTYSLYIELTQVYAINEYYCNMQYLYNELPTSKNEQVWKIPFTI